MAKDSLTVQKQSATTGDATPVVDLRPVAQALGRPLHHVQAAVALFDEGNTIPFVARYRKEHTGGMDDAELRTLFEELAKLRALEERRADVLRLLSEHGHLTPELEQDVRAATSLQRLEDLYRPYRPKRTTRASVAKERGLEPLAEWLLARGSGDPEAEAAKYVNDDVPDEKSALQGARDIIAERLSDDPELRSQLRALLWDKGMLSTTFRPGVAAGLATGLESGVAPGASSDAAEKAAGAAEGTATVERTAAERAAVYEAYADYAEPVKRIPPHRVLAINRGEREKVLTVAVALDEGDEERFLDFIERAALAMPSRSGESADGPSADQRPFGASACDIHLREAAHDSAKRLIFPSIEREIRNELTEVAHEQALGVFRANLRSLLLQAPLRGHVVIGLDPAFRTGVKVAVVDETGRLLATDVIYPTPPHNKTVEAARRLSELVDEHGVTTIAIGNGTASRETERFVADWLREQPEGKRPAYAIIDEAGASIYSASPLAKEEFPTLDASERSAVSIARRLQDPLAELVKIEPRSLGVGQYQHDVDAKRLEEQLAGVVEGTVNEVGVDLNTASVSLLSYVAGVSKTVAANIVARREAEGPFRSRRELLSVSRLGPRTFEQCAGFLQIPGAEYPLDRTPIHPESYEAAEQLLAEVGVSLEDVGDGPEGQRVAAALEALGDDDIARLATTIGCGEPTLRDIVEALKRPGRDLREDLPPPALRSDVLDIDDLEEGMVLTGTVRNVVDFGAFVDIGVGQDGLVHISELADRFVKHPLDVVTVGDTVDVRVISVDKRRGRIGLSMRL